jgi:hypothetical protein
MLMKTIFYDKTDGLLRLIFVATVFVFLIIFIAVMQDFFHSLRHSYPFYLHESLIFKGYWLVLPSVILATSFFYRLRPPSSGYLELLVWMIGASFAHLLVGSIAIWILSILFKEQSYEFFKIFTYVASNNLVNTICLYGFFMLVFQYGPSISKKTKSYENEVIPNKPKVTSLSIKQGQKVFCIDVNDIVLIEAATPYVSIYLSTSSYLYSSSIKSLLNELDERFIRIHRGAIVNINKVSFSQSRLNGDYDLTLDNDMKTRLSRSYAKQFKIRFAPATSS